MKHIFGSSLSEQFRELHDPSQYNSWKDECDDWEDAVYQLGIWPAEQDVLTDVDITMDISRQGCNGTVSFSDDAGPVSIGYDKYCQAEQHMIENSADMDDYKTNFKKWLFNLMRTGRSDIFSATKRDALKSIQNTLISQGSNCKINRSHNCVDVFDDNGNIIEQVYPKLSGTRPGSRVRYQYVGQGNGDFIQFTQAVNESDYDPDDTYVKYIRTTNDPNDKRI